MRSGAGPDVLVSLVSRLSRSTASASGRASRMTRVAVLAAAGLDEADVSVPERPAASATAATLHGGMATTTDRAAESRPRRSGRLGPAWPLATSPVRSDARRSRCGVFVQRLLHHDDGPRVLGIRIRTAETRRPTEHGAAHAVPTGTALSWASPASWTSSRWLTVLIAAERRCASR